MVRIIGHHFSPPRSRHSSGETDRDLAERADSALSTLGRKRFEFTECESSSDSFWDSELDGDHLETNVSETGEGTDDINGNQSLVKSDAQVKRKERRRERNKVSAQAYRRRQRQLSAKEQQELLGLEERNRHLKNQVELLQKKTELAKKLLLGEQPSMRMPDILELTSAESEVASNDPACSDTASEVAGPQGHCGGQAKCEAHLNFNLNNNAICDPHVHVPNQDLLTPDASQLEASGAVSSYPPIQPVTVSLQSQVLINTNAFLGANLSTQGIPFPSSTMPTYLAVPLTPDQSLNKNLNCNVPNLPTPLSKSNVEFSHVHDDGRPLLTMSPSSVGAFCTGDTQAAAFGQGTSSFTADRQPILCNNNNLSLNKNSNFVTPKKNNSGQSCDNFLLQKVTTNTLSNNVNLNANVAGAAQNQDGGVEGNKQLGQRGCHSVFASSNDQSHAVPVQ